MLPVSQFGGGARAEEKQNVIDRVKEVFERDLHICSDIFGG